MGPPWCSPHPSDWPSILPTLIRITYRQHMNPIIVFYDVRTQAALLGARPHSWWVLLITFRAVYTTHTHHIDDHICITGMLYPCPTAPHSPGFDDRPLTLWLPLGQWWGPPRWWRVKVPPSLPRQERTKLPWYRKSSSCWQWLQTYPSSHILTHFTSSRYYKHNL